jgi:FtsH-binding integral membrane protein
MAAMQYETDAYILNFDIADVTIKEDPLYAKGWLNLKICDLLIRVYKILAWPLLALAMISYIVVFVKIFDKGQDKKQKEIMTKAFVVVTGLLLSAMLLAGGVTYRYAEARNSSGRNLYMAGTYPLYHIFVLGSITLFYCFVVSPKLTDRRKRMEKE